MRLYKAAAFAAQKLLLCRVFGKPDIRAALRAKTKSAGGLNGSNLLAYHTNRQTFDSKVLLAEVNLNGLVVGVFR